MWHEARRQEKKIRGLMVDFKKRADRRREYYEKIKLDPTQFLRVYGRPYKVNYDPAVALAAESPQSMMPWQGDSSNMIDRFDVRAHLDIIPEAPSRTRDTELSREEEEEERQANYERYRTLVENEASGLTEEQCLNEIYIDEHFGPPLKTGEEEKKKNADKKAAIGYTYEDSTPANPGDDDDDEDDSDEESSDTDVETADLDVTLDVDLLTSEQAGEINAFANQYGMKEQDFVRLLRRDKAEMEALKYAKQMEEEKAQFSGRKSRRERRAFKEKQLQGRRLSPPSYAARSSPKYEPYKRAGSSSRSRSRSPEDVGQVKFITSFGAESDEEGASGAVQGPSLPPVRSDGSSVNESHCDTVRHQPWKSKARPQNLRQKGARSRSRTRSRSRSRRRSDSRNHFRRDRRSRSRSYERRTQGWRERQGRYRDPPRTGRFDRERTSSTWGRPRADRNRSRSTSRGYRRSRSRSRASKSRSRSRSRAGTKSSRSRSSSRSKSISRSRSKSRSKSQSKERSMSTSPQRPATVKRYRRHSLSSRSSASDDEDSKSTKKDGASSSRNKSGGGSTLQGNSGGGSQGKLTPRERLKRRMQAQLIKQYKADKKAEVSKISKIEQERMDREEELRTRTMEMRRREREKRHREMEALERERKLRGAESDDTDTSDSDKEYSRRRHSSRSDSRENSPMDTARRRSVSRSRSRSTSSERRGLVSY